MITKHQNLCRYLPARHLLVHFCLCVFVSNFCGPLFDKAGVEQARTSLVENGIIHAKHFCKSFRQDTLLQGLATKLLHNAVVQYVRRRKLCVDKRHISAQKGMKPYFL